MPVDFEHMNVSGSGISLGHPVGATGLRILATLLRELDRRKAGYALATMCISGPQPSDRRWLRPAVFGSRWEGYAGRLEQPLCRSENGGMLALGRKLGFRLATEPGSATITNLTVDLTAWPPAGAAG